MNRNFHLLYRLAIVGAVTLPAVVAQGVLSNRWQPSSALVDAAAVLQHVPEEFGDWKCEDSRTLSDATLAVLECRGYIDRTYVNTQTGAKVLVSLLAGPSGPMSVHDPEVCYRGLNLETTAASEKFTLAGPAPHDGAGPHPTFYRVTFRTGDLAASYLRVYFSWSPDMAWSAPDYPRLAFATHDALYKLQVACHLPQTAEDTPHDAAQEFLRDFVPLLRELYTGQQTNN